MRRRSQLFHLISVDRFDQFVPCREMAIQGAGSDTRVFRDVVQTGIRPMEGKSTLRHFENALAVAQSIGSRLSLSGLGGLFFQS
jgi:hypothetical protein